MSYIEPIGIDRFAKFDPAIKATVAPLDDVKVRVELDCLMRRDYAGFEALRDGSAKIGKRHDCRNVRPLRKYEKGNLAGNGVFRVEICCDCYSERVD